MSRRSVLAFLAVALAAAARNPYLEDKHFVRRAIADLDMQEPGYRGSMFAGAAVVVRPDGSRLDPLPLVLVEAMPSSALFSKFRPGESWTLPLADIDRFLAEAADWRHSHLDPTPGAYRRPDLAEASTWRYRPDPEEMERARSLRAGFIERQERRTG